MTDHSPAAVAKALRSVCASWRATGNSALVLCASQIEGIIERDEEQV